MTRRDAVADVMGVKRQLCFPTAWHGNLPRHVSEDMQAMPSIQGDRVGYGKELTNAYIDWACAHECPTGFASFCRCLPTT
jgi:hypothetical protein